MHLEIESTVIAAANPEGQVAFINQHVEVIWADKDKDKDKDKDRIALSIHNHYVSFLIILILIFKIIILSSLILSHKHRQGLTETDSQTRKRRTLKDRRTKGGRTESLQKEWVWLSSSSPWWSSLWSLWSGSDPQVWSASSLAQWGRWGQAGCSDDEKYHHRAINHSTSSLSLQYSLIKKSWWWC